MKNTQLPETSISIPVLASPVAKPILEDIPQMDSSTLTEIQQSQVSLVLGAYNRNILRLIGYSIRLGGFADASDEYIRAIEEALKDCEK